MNWKLQGNSTPGERLIKDMSVKTKWRINITASFILFALGLLFFCESFFRLRTGNDTPTWVFGLVMSTLILFISMVLFGNAVGHQSTLNTRRLIKKSTKRQRKNVTGDLEIQKSPQK